MSRSKAKSSSDVAMNNTDYPDITGSVFQEAERIESSKEPYPVSSASGMSEIAACPLSSIADDPSALPSPTSSPSSSQ